MVNISKNIWYWYHNVSECYYHVQLTVKYRKALLDNRAESIIIGTLQGIKERYAIEISHLGFDQDHIHLLLRFLPTYSAGQVIKVVKSLTAKAIFEQLPEIKKELWGGEFWTDGYYVATISGRGNKKVIENYIKNQGREQDIKQLRLFNLGA
ncbi:IS200/IS605 family transposase [bacterium (Candidatus Gribaldobacteria) CG_4_10_14_0_2_um_filter_41_16]|uniref:IS200/IS605 family transposase n=1 Tax=bacterium (Candidatus Gribaldobacteria) CG_4_10_14_0_2_um_filter_41_16 TaxID=2014265 RepID=A0A2M7VIY2_9BACT|nr:MAG: IS200/IS605 family transposase [bacterium (Candidatus Gribaldobacteria) CG_4_10_14_0_2_um_filter_41_16]